MEKEAEDRQEKPMSQDNPNLLVAQFQSYQQQLQSILIQKDSIAKSLGIAKLQTMENDKALEELGKTQQKSAYRITGQIMISKPVEELKKDLEEMKESIQLREKSLQKSEESLQKSEERVSGKMREIQEKLKEMMK